MLRMIVADFLADGGARARRLLERCRQQQVNAKGLVRKAANLADPLLHLLRREVGTAKHAEAASIRDSGDQSRWRAHAPRAHAGEDYRILNAQQIAERCVEVGHGSFLHCVPEVAGHLIYSPEVAERLLCSPEVAERL